MKKVSLFQLVLFSAFLNSGISIAQSTQHNHHKHDNNEQSSIVTASDIKNIKGFDEVAAIKELTNNGIH